MSTAFIMANLIPMHTRGPPRPGGDRDAARQAEHSRWQDDGVVAEEPMVRLILDGIVVRVRLDRKATSILLLDVIGVRRDGQKVLLAIKSMGGESAEAWRAVLDDLIERGLKRPEFLIIDGVPGLDKAIAAVWDGVAVQRCTVRKLRNRSVPLTRQCTALLTEQVHFPRPSETVMRQLSAWLTHYNEVHPHKALGYRLPREFIAAHGKPDRVQSFGGHNGGHFSVCEVVSYGPT